LQVSEWTLQAHGSETDLEDCKDNRDEPVEEAVEKQELESKQILNILSLY